jgi:nucleobase:cation symporter-1, NCS1 family
MSETLTNRDLAPTPPAARTWSAWDLASLWVGMSICIPSYMLASTMIGAGVGWKASLAAVFAGNAIVLVPMLIHGHAGARYGIPFPVFARAAFGVRGTHLPSMLRAIVACGWFGIQTWVGGLAMLALTALFWPGIADLGGAWRFMGHSLAEFAAFGVFWLMNLYFVWAGTESIRRLETWSAPLLIGLCLALVWWGATVAGGIGGMLGGADRLEAAATGDRSAAALVPWVTAMVGYWATLSLNIPDFTRYSRSQRDQAVGQAVGILTTMPFIAAVGVLVTGAAVVHYGEAIWNPVDLLARLSRESGTPLVGAVAMVAVLIATLTTNIAANIVAPANSIANWSPQTISFRAGGLLAGAIGIVIAPWALLDRYQTWLLTYSGLLGAVGGVLTCDYVVIRRGVLVVPDLYAAAGRYSYRAGVNPAALWALAAGVAVAGLGLVSPALAFLFDGAWFSAALVSSVVYFVLMRRTSPTDDRQQPVVEVVA